MKRLLVTFGFLLAAFYIMAQVSNVAEFRIANATKQFGVNLPVGTKVFNIATGEYWVATGAVASTATLTSASASFSKLNDLGTDDQNASEVQVTASGNLTSTNVQAALTELQGDIDGISNTDNQTAAEVNITDNDNDYTATNVEGALAEIGDSITTHRTDLDQNTSDIATNTAAIAAFTDTDDQTIDKFNLNGTTLELSLEADGQVDQTVDLSSLQDGTGTDDQGLTYNASTHAIDIENGSNAIIPLATNSAAGLASAAHITSIETNTTNISTNTTNISNNASNISALEALTSKTDSFEVASDDLDGSDYSLSQTALSQHGIQVSVNGAITTDFTFASNKVTLSAPVYQYDKIVVSYTY